MSSKDPKQFGDREKDTHMWFRKVLIKEKKDNIYALESVKFPGWYVVDPGVSGKGGFELRQASNILTLPENDQWGYFNIIWYHDF